MIDGRHLFRRPAYKKRAEAEDDKVPSSRRIPPRPLGQSHKNKSVNC